MQQRKLALFDLVEIDVAAAARKAGDAAAVDPSPIGEKFEADQVRIAGECRRPCVRGIAVARGAKGQNLPDMLSRFGEEGNEFVSGGAKIADAAIGRQRADMKQNSGGTLELHT
jgi:hypothetical protein